MEWIKERKDIFDFYLKGVKVDPNANINTEILARKTLWFSPADIDYMIREAGIIALRDRREEVNNKDLSEAYDRIAFGMKSNIKRSDKSKLWTAYHEAGHAIIGYLLHPTDDVIKATVIPRKGFYGAVFSSPQEEYKSSNKEELLADIKRCIAAYVAERIKFGTTSQGVGGAPGSDFYTAISIASRMVRSYGMGKSGLVGDFLYPEKYHFLSEKTKEMLDSDIQAILNTCIKEVETVLTEKSDLLEYFSEELYKKEELEYDEIEAIFEKFGLKRAALPVV